MIPVLVKELRDAVRSRWLLAYAGALGLLGLAAALVGLRGAPGLTLQAFGRTAATLTNLCLLLAPLVALAMGSLAIAGERDRGTLDHLLAQPLSRRELLWGKYLGLLAALLAATFAGFAPAALVLATGGGAGELVRLAPFPLLAGALVAPMLALGVAISVRCGSGIQALGVALAAWFLFVLLYDLLLIGALVSGGLGAGPLAALLVANPVDSARVLVILSLEPDLYLLGPAGALLVETLSATGTALVLCASLLLWTVAPLALATAAFRLRPQPEAQTQAPDHPPTWRRRIVKSTPRSRTLLTLILAAPLWLAGCGPAAEESPGGTATAVAVTAAHLERGREVYKANCVPCHGPEGRGDGPAAATLNPKPRNHADPELMAQLSDKRIAETVRMGGIISGYPNMPASPHLRGEDLVALVAFVRSLHQDEVKWVDLEGVGQ